VSRHFSRLGLLAALIVAAVALAFALGGAANGLAKQQAVTLATTRAQALSSTPVTVVSADSGRTGDFDTGTSDSDHHVWAVTFHGTFSAPSCGPSGTPPNACPSANTSVRMFLDYDSGAFVMAEEPAP
jgi:hypothetical protein